MASFVHQSTVAGTRWDPQQYMKFSDHRLRPALELLTRIPHPNPHLIYDLGCGTGNVTQHIGERWTEAQIVGVDNSTQMIQQAKQQHSEIIWTEADIRTWSPERSPDLLYSNATLQWVEGHETLFPRLFNYLPSGGCLAVQMPLSWESPSHQLMYQTLHDGGTDGGPLGDPTLQKSLERRWVQEASFYYSLLVRAEAAHLDLWETQYLQVLEGEDPVLEWVKATGLRPVLNVLSNREREQYLSVYASRLRDAYPRLANGKTLYPFRRLFIVAIHA